VLGLHVLLLGAVPRVCYKLALQLSTGNLDVEALAWHEASSSLIASCNSNPETGGLTTDNGAMLGEHQRVLVLLALLLGACAKGLS
jgi:hypothetical protein